MSLLGRCMIVVLGIYCGLRYGIRPPLPSSVVFMLMALAVLTTLLYVTVYEQDIRALRNPILAFMRGENRQTRYMIAARWAVMIALPITAAWYSFSLVAPSYTPPPEQHVVHPAPPTEYVGLANPLPWTDENIGIGMGWYFANCMPCHGPNGDGRGPEWRGFNPPPANFTDVGTIAQLQESYVFWRIKTGGPGLPRESEPWRSAMPRWEGRMSDEDIWRTVMALYTLAKQKPRTWEPGQ